MLETFVKLRTWVLSNRKKLGINIEINEEPITTAEGLSTLNNDKRIEGIEYYQDEKDNNKNKIIAYYQEGETIKGFVFPVSEKGLSEKQQKEINNMAEKSFKDLINWIDKNKNSEIGDIFYIDKADITTAEELMSLGTVKISDIKYNAENKKIYIQYEKQDDTTKENIKGVSFSIFEKLILEQEKEFTDKGNITGKSLVSWVLNNRKKLGINIEIKEEPITTEANLLKIDDAKKIEGIEYYQENGENKIIAYCQEGETIKGFVFPVSEELTGNEPNEISYMLEKKFNKLKDWILDREYAGKITTAEYLMKLNNEAIILGINHNSNNKKFYFKYKEGNKEKRGRLNLNKEINNISDTLPNKNLKDIVELKKWILNNRKKLGINIQIEEKPITTAEELTELDNDKKIEEIEYYQDEQDNKYKVIAYYQDDTNGTNTTKGVVLPFSKAGL